MKKGRMGKLDSIVTKQDYYKGAVLGYPLPQQKFWLTKRRFSLKIPLIIITAILLLAFLLLTYIYLENTATALSYEVNKSAQSLNLLQSENKSYELEVLELRSLDRIEETARHKLGMSEPDSFILETVTK